MIRQRSGDATRVRSQRFPRSTVAHGITIGAIWSLLALLSIGQTALYLAHRGEPIPWRHLAVGRLADWYTCALFLPPLVWLARRFPIERGTWRRALPLQLLASVVCTVAKCAMSVPVDRLLGARRVTFVGVLAADTWSELLIFWSVLGIIHAGEFYRRYEERRADALRLASDLTNAQLQALTAQLRPHFLFNTLSAIGELTHTDPGAADRMLTELAELLRQTLRRPGNADICVGEELALVQHYVSIMQMRYGDRVTVDYDVPPEVHAAMVPPFLLQPLVENAFEHGVAERRGVARVRISACVASHGAARELHLMVEDDGPGITASAPVERVGLASTRRRLAMRYGADHRLVLQRQTDGGTRALVAIPLVVTRT